MNIEKPDSIKGIHEESKDLPTPMEALGALVGSAYNIRVYDTETQPQGFYSSPLPTVTYVSLDLARTDAEVDLQSQITALPGIVPSDVVDTSAFKMWQWSSTRGEVHTDAVTVTMDISNEPEARDLLKLSEVTTAVALARIFYPNKEANLEERKFPYNALNAVTSPKAKEALFELRDLSKQDLRVNAEEVLQSLEKIRSAIDPTSALQVQGLNSLAFYYLATGRMSTSDSLR